ncbi:MAG: hypothetical protein H7222_15090 [Methylotenera sp.]|nr:hypothetical protein [Oligoflexia bacterium]
MRSAVALGSLTFLKDFACPEDFTGTRGFAGLRRFARTAREAFDEGVICVIRDMLRSHFCSMAMERIASSRIE